MSKTSRELDSLRDNEDAIQRILDYIEGLTWEVYLKDYKTQDAVVRNLEVIGEATKHLSDELRLSHPDIPWRDMAGTRDRLTHHYFGINQEIVWQIIAQDLPPLQSQIKIAIDQFIEGTS